MLSIHVDQIRLDVPHFRPGAVDADVVGRLRIREAGVELLAEPEFPVVELAIALDGWNRFGMAERTDFVFTSLSSEDPDILRFVSTPSGWRMRSAWVASDSTDILSNRRMRELSTRFVDAVEAGVRTSLGRQVWAEMRSMMISDSD